MSAHISDEEIIAAAVERNKTAAIIFDGQARVIAAVWHGGQASALCALATSGAIDEDRCIAELDREWMMSGPDSLTRAPELLALTRYVVDRGDRGPVPGWSKLWGQDNEKTEPWCVHGVLPASACALCSAGEEDGS